MIKLIIFDLDGVLIDTKNIHYDSLNKALGPKYLINWDEHLSLYDGLKTNQKLEILNEKKGLPKKLYQKIWEDKQKFTLEKIRNVNQSNELIECFSTLINLGYKIAVCSNSIKKTVLITLLKLGIIEYIDLIISNEDVKNAKPHPEMYWTAISTMRVLPEETLIIEDSPAGLLAASKANTHVLRVSNPTEVNIKKIKDKLNQIKSNQKINIPKWHDEKINVLIPMAGAGTRFKEIGFTLPKPLINVMGKPMIQLVVENLNIDANFIYVVQKEHRKEYNLDILLNIITPNCSIIEVDHLTAGAACTSILAKELINNDNPLFFANSDQFVEWDSNNFFYKMNETDSDGCIITFNDTHPKWSFVKVDETGFVTEVAEKNVISDIATVGFYYWKKGSDFVKYAEQMIKSNIRVNNEFYVAPVFNEAIKDDKKIRTFNVNKMWGLGTPEDLSFFIKNLKNKMITSL